MRTNWKHQPTLRYVSNYFISWTMILGPPRPFFVRQGATVATTSAASAATATAAFYSANSRQGLGLGGLASWLASKAGQPKKLTTCLKEEKKIFKVMTVPDFYVNSRETFIQP